MKFLKTALKRIVLFLVFLAFAATNLFLAIGIFWAARVFPSPIDNSHMISDTTAFILLCAGIYLLRNAFRSIFPKN